MLGELNAEEIEEVLHSEVVGRIGCHADNLTYVVPVTFAYHDGCIFGHSVSGMKVHMMRTNPAVCFEVEHVDSMASWRTVIAWGRYEELEGPDAAAAMQLLVDRLAPLMTSATAQPPHGTDAPGPHVVIYRIQLTEKTGRYEKG